MKIILGTTNDYKISLLREIVKELDLKGTVLGFAADSGVSDQPIGSSVIKKGAIKRARLALESSRSKDAIGVGIEVGYEKNKNGLLEMTCWTAVFDGSKEYLAKSHNFLLPRFHNKIIQNGKYLGDHVRDFAKNSDNSATKVVREMIIHREPFIRISTHNALVLFFSKEEY